MAGDAVNRAIQHLVSLVDIDRRKRALKDDAVFNVGEARSALELIENHLAIGGEHLRPVMLWPQKWGVHQNVECIAAWQAQSLGR